MIWTLPSKIIVQGITEPQGLHHIRNMKAYGTEIVAGVDIGGGDREIEDIPVFELVEQAIERVGEITTTLIFSKSDRVLDAALEAIAAKIPQILIHTSGVPPLDMVRLLKIAKITNTLILGPGSGGILVPEKILLGTLEPSFYQSGNIGLINCCNPLSYEVALELNRASLGESLVVSVGTEVILGSDCQQWLQVMEDDPQTEAIVLIGQPGDGAEEAVTNFISSCVSKPVIAYIAGLQTPIERPFRDAAAIVANQLSYSPPSIKRDKHLITALQKAHVSLAKRPSQIPDLIKKGLGIRGETARE
ncbi:MAG: succinate--CoA ligase subunit alpha [Xenococcaceae cyanobacterium]